MRLPLVLPLSAPLCDKLQDTSDHNSAPCYISVYMVDSNQNDTDEVIWLDGDSLEAS